MTEYVLLILVLLLYAIAKGSSHVGEPCNRIIKICLASNSFCDDQDICRCKPKYPVSVSPHTCKKGKRYNEDCSFTEECTYFDDNSYCTQLPYRSTCECFSGFLYNEASQHCEELVEDFPDRGSNLLVPTAIGLSLAFISILCCCLILWRICKRQNPGSHWSFFPRNSMTNYPQQEPYNVEACDSFLSTDEALPTYDSALSQKSIDEECEPPPSYDEVVQSLNEPAKS